MVVFPHAKINIGLFVTGKRKEKAGVSDLRIPVWKWEEIPGKIW